MPRWFLPLLPVFLACLLLLASFARGPGLLTDTDTAAMLRGISARHAPLSWFASDWPLENHFYRPTSTLTFEADHALYKHRAGGYGFTNALIAVACIFALFWFLSELTERIWLASLGATLFALWHFDAGPLLAALTDWLLIAALIGGAIRHRQRFKEYLPAVALWAFVGYELMSLEPLRWRMIDWLPGRTASVMTFFALAALAAYARYERLGAQKAAQEIGPLDPPATRNTVLTDRKGSVGWVLLAGICVALALGSYEQAVMLPAALLGVAVCMRLRHYRVRWGWQVVFWGLLVGYLFLRKAVVPSDVSGYQAQQFRHSISVFNDITRYAIPFYRPLVGWFGMLAEGWVLIVVPSFWIPIWQTISAVYSYLLLRKEWALALTGWALPVIAFLPMAWLKPFSHYHYWPLALESLFVALLIVRAGQLTLNAWSPRVLQAPPRPAPAPGSLLHR